ncbi:MAG: O-antigen ligase family protein [Lachnospiraceae bacterium]
MQYISKGYFMWVTLFIPLYFENAYFNMLQAKGHIYIVGAALYLLSIAFLCVIKKSVKDCLPGKSVLDWSVFLLGITALLSCLLSEDMKASFWGSNGWWVGAFVFLTFALFYQVLSKNLQLNQNIWLPVLIVNMFIFVMGILHSARIDVLSLHENIYPKQYYWYISTIGNTNWYVGYLCLIIPLVLVFYLECEDVFSRRIYFVFLALACINIVLCGSDGIYLGFGICAFFSIPYIVAEEKRVCRMFEVLICYGGGLLLVRFCPVFAGKLADIEGLSKIFLRPAFSITLVLVSLCGRILAKKRWGKLDKKCKNAVTAILEMMLGVCAAVFLFRAICNFGESWGTNRGRTWKYCAELFQTFSVKQKLFGVGPEMLKTYFEELSTHFSRQILVAHSELMQLLMTIGVLGLLCWLLMWGSVVGSYFKNKIWKKGNIAFLLPLIAYLGQSLVNSPQTTNVALLCVLMACYRKSEI